MDLTPLTVSATRLADGKTIPLEGIQSVEVAASLQSPAESLRLTAAVRRFPGELGAVTVRQGPRTVFTGRVDKQTGSLSGAGRLLTVEARSKGALLLDNEAVPCTLTGPRLTTVFGLFVAPYGFLLYAPERGGGLPEYTVPKGSSEWEAFAGFVRRTLGRTPYVTGDQVVVDRPRSAVPLVIGGGGIPYCEVEHVTAPYHILSKVVLRDMDGAYRSAVHNSSAAYYGVRRKRYVIPANEFIDAPALDANQRIRRSMLRRETATVTLPGLVPVSLGREVRLADEEFRLQNLMAGEVVWRQDKGGLVTVLSLISSIYYD